MWWQARLFSSLFKPEQRKDENRGLMRVSSSGSMPPCCEAPLGGSHCSVGSTASDSHVIPSKAQKRKRQCARTRLTHYRIQQSQGLSEQTLTLPSLTHSPLLYLTDMQSTVYTERALLTAVSTQCLAQKHNTVNVMGNKFKSHSILYGKMTWQEAMEKAFRPTAGKKKPCMLSLS